MTGDLPDITLDISDFKLEELMKLILSIPFPEGRPKPADDAPKVYLIHGCKYGPL